MDVWLEWVRQSEGDTVYWEAEWDILRLGGNNCSCDSMSVGLLFHLLVSLLHQISIQLFCIRNQLLPEFSFHQLPEHFHHKLVSRTGSQTQQRYGKLQIYNYSLILPYDWPHAKPPVEESNPYWSIGIITEWAEIKGIKLSCCENWILYIYNAVMCCTNVCTKCVYQWLVGFWGDFGSCSTMGISATWLHPWCHRQFGGEPVSVGND